MSRSTENLEVKDKNSYDFDINPKKGTQYLKQNSQRPQK